MYRQIRVHIEGDSCDVLTGAFIRFDINELLTSRYLAHELKNYMFDAYHDYELYNSIPDYAYGMSYLGNENPTANFMHIIMLSLSREITPEDMARTIYGTSYLGEEKDDYMQTLTDMVSNLAERHIIETQTEPSPSGTVITIRWRSPRVPVSTTVRYMFEEEGWKMWWWACFDALKQCSTRDTTPHHIPHRPQISEEALLAFLAQ